MIQRFPGQRAIVVVGYQRSAVFAFVDGQYLTTEIDEIGYSPHDVFAKADNLPTERGAYLWEGDYVVDDGKGGDPAGQGDCDSWFDGKFSLISPMGAAAMQAFRLKPWPFIETGEPVPPIEIEQPAADDSNAKLAS